MSGLKNILVMWHLFGSFPDKFVMYGVTIKSPIESPMVSPAILNSSGSRVQDQPYREYLYPHKTNNISRSPWPGTTGAPLLLLLSRWQGGDSCRRGGRGGEWRRWRRQQSCALGAQQSRQQRRQRRYKNDNDEEDNDDGQGRCNCWGLGGDADIKVGDMAASPSV